MPLRAPRTDSLHVVQEGTMSPIPNDSTYDPSTRSTLLAYSLTSAHKAAREKAAASQEAAAVAAAKNKSNGEGAADEASSTDSAQTSIHNLKQTLSWLSSISYEDVEEIGRLESSRQVEVPVHAAEGSTPSEAGELKSGWILELDLDASTATLFRKRRFRKNLQVFSFPLTTLLVVPEPGNPNAFTLSTLDTTPSHVLAVKTFSRPFLMAVLDSFSRAAAGSALASSLLGKQCRVTHALRGSELYKYGKGALVRVDSLVAGGWVEILDSRQDRSFLHAITLSPTS